MGEDNIIYGDRDLYDTKLVIELPEDTDDDDNDSEE